MRREEGAIDIMEEGIVPSDSKRFHGDDGPEGKAGGCSSNPPNAWTSRVNSATPPPTSAAPNVLEHQERSRGLGDSRFTYNNENNSANDQSGFNSRVASVGPEVGYEFTAFGTGYIHRMGAVKADPYDNKRNETMYFYTDSDSNAQQFDGTWKPPVVSRVPQSPRLPASSISSYFR